MSWICLHFSTQIFTPVLFDLRGPADAGRFGMSIGITIYLATLVLAWTSTKATPFGRMIARGEVHELRRVFYRCLKQALLVLLALSALCELLVIVLQRTFPGLAVRMLPPSLFILLLLGSAGGFVVQSLATYLRAFKREPLLWQSLLVATSTVLLSLLTAKPWGLTGAALAYFASTGVLGLAGGLVIFRRQSSLHV